MHDIIIDLLNSLSAVRSLSELDSQEVDERSLIRKALQVLIQNQDMERCSFFLFDGDEFLDNLTGLSSEEHSGVQASKYSSIKFKLGEGVIGLAAQTGELQLCNDCHNDSRFVKHGQQAEFLPGSLISVPVFVAGNLLGVLNISHPEANYFSEWHMRLLHIYKNMLGQLISNNRLLSDMEEQISLRTAKLEKALQDVKLLKDRYENLSMIDDLTGLFNRRYFYMRVETALANSRRYHQPLCLLMLDIDFFKKINDEHGHLCGDRVLIQISSLLKKQIRESDLLVRFGGEEFVVIFTNTDCNNGKIFSERIRQEIEHEKIEFDGKSIQTTVSIGIHCLCFEKEKMESSDIDSLVNSADLALYQAKGFGRNRVEVFHNGLGNKQFSPKIE